MFASGNPVSFSTLSSSCDPDCGILLFLPLPCLTSPPSHVYHPLQPQITLSENNDYFKKTLKWRQHRLLSYIYVLCFLPCGISIFPCVFLVLLLRFLQIPQFSERRASQLVDDCWLTDRSKTSTKGCHLSDDSLLLLISGSETFYG